jgi:hypothetical protein
VVGLTLSSGDMGLKPRGSQKLILIHDLKVVASLVHEDLLQQVVTFQEEINSKAIVPVGYSFFPENAECKMPNGEYQRSSHRCGGIA